MKNIFKITAFLEGASYLILLFFAMPMKYFANDPSYVKMLGMPHGILFILYVILAFLIKNEMKWDLKTLAIVLVASILPFGTFYIDRKYLK